MRLVARQEFEEDRRERLLPALIAGVGRACLSAPRIARRIRSGRRAAAPERQAGGHQRRRVLQPGSSRPTCQRGGQCARVRPEPTRCQHLRQPLAQPALPLQPVGVTQADTLQAMAQTGHSRQQRAPQRGERALARPAARPAAAATQAGLIVADIDDQLRVRQPDVGDVGRQARADAQRGVGAQRDSAQRQAIDHFAQRLAAHASALQGERRMGAGPGLPRARRGEVGCIAKRVGISRQPLGQGVRLPQRQCAQLGVEEGLQLRAVGGHGRQPAASTRRGTHQFQTQRVKGVYGDVRVTAGQPLADLGANRVVEGEQRDLLRLCQSAHHQIGDLAEQQRGLARTRRGHHQRGVLIDHDGGALLVIERLREDTIEEFAQSGQLAALESGVVGAPRRLVEFVGFRAGDPAVGQGLRGRCGSGGHARKARPAPPGRLRPTGRYRWP